MDLRSTNNLRFHTNLKRDSWMSVNMTKQNDYLGGIGLNEISLNSVITKVLDDIEMHKAREDDSNTLQRIRLIFMSKKKAQI